MHPSPPSRSALAFVPAPGLPLRAARANHPATSHKVPTMIRAPPTRPLTVAPPKPSHIVAPPSTPPSTPDVFTASPDPSTFPTDPSAFTPDTPSPDSPAFPTDPSAFTPEPPAAFPTDPPHYIPRKPNRRTKAAAMARSAVAAVDHLVRDSHREYYYHDLATRRTTRPSRGRPSTTTRRQKRQPRAPKQILAPPEPYVTEYNTDSTDATNAVKAAKDKRKRSTTRRNGPATDDSIRRYLHEIGEVKLLDAESEINLAREIAKLLELERISATLKDANGFEPAIPEWAAAADMNIEVFRETLRRGLRAKEHMVAANLRLVVSIAKKYLNRGLSFQDLIQEGSIGLIRGAEKFDGNKGFKFSTYATWWIRQAITRAIADHSRPIRLPVHVNDTIAAIKKATKLLSTEMNRSPTETEIAERLQISIEKLRFLSTSARATISLETPIGRDGKESNATLGSFIVWEGDTPEESTMKSLLREDLENVLNTLSPRERDVVRMRYGFDDGKMKTLEEIGCLFAVTRERIRQIEAKALRKLRHPNRNAVLRDYVYDEK